MFVVSFFENRQLILSQLTRSVPAVGENVTIKGRKGKVLSINSMDSNKIHVHITLEKINNKKLVIDNSKKKKR